MIEKKRMGTMINIVIMFVCDLNIGLFLAKLTSSWFLEREIRVFSIKE